MHISKHEDKRASTLATADLQYKQFERQDPYHQRIQDHAKLLTQNNLGYCTYIGQGQAETRWQGEFTITLVRNCQVRTY